MNRYDQYKDVIRSLKNSQQPDEERLTALEGFLRRQQQKKLMKLAVFNAQDTAQQIGEWLDWDWPDTMAPANVIKGWIKTAADQNDLDAARTIHEIALDNDLYDDLTDRELVDCWVKRAGQAFAEHNETMADELLRQARDIGFEDYDHRTMTEEYQLALSGTLRKRFPDLDDDEVERLLDEGAEVSRFTLEKLLEHERFERFEDLYDRTNLDERDRRKLLQSNLNHEQAYRFVVENGYVTGEKTNLSSLFSRAVRFDNPDALLRIADTSLRSYDSLRSVIGSFFVSKWSSRKERQAGRFLIEFAAENDQLDDALLKTALEAALKKIDHRPGSKLKLLYEHGASLNMLDASGTGIDSPVSGLNRDGGLVLDIIMKNDQLDDDIADKIIREYNHTDTTEALRELLQLYRPDSIKDTFLQVFNDNKRDGRPSLVETWVKMINHNDWTIEDPDKLMAELVTAEFKNSSSDAPTEDEFEVLLDLPIGGAHFDQTYEQLDRIQAPGTRECAKQLAAHNIRPSSTVLSELDSDIVHAIEEHLTGRQKQAYEQLDG